MASAVDLVPTMLAFAGVRTEDVDTRETGLPGASLVGALEGRAVRDGVVTAAENLMTLDASFWQEFGTPDAIERAMSGELRPSWDKRGFLRGWTDERYSFGRYFSPIDPNRPRTLDDLYARNDVVLYDRETDPDEVVNLATDPAHRALVATLSAKLVAAIDAEIGEDSKAWVTERPNLHAWPKWNGDRTRAPA
jgi:arylsulfatase